jgi:hypothetical protein
MSRALASTSGPVLGVKRFPLLDCIGVDRYMCPMLHLLLGLANDVLNNIFNYADERNGLEGVPENIKEARIAVMDARTEYTSFNTALLAWDQLNAGHLATLRLSRCQIREWLKQPRRFLPSEQKKEMLAAKISLTTEIDQLVKDRKGLETAAKPVKVKLDKAKKHLESVSALFKTKDKKLRAEIETILKAYGIDQGAHHGGDMVGNSCKKFLSHSTSIMGEIKELLCTVGEDSQMTHGAIMRIQTRCDVTASLLTNYDGFFSRLRLAKEDYTSDTVEEARTFIGNGMQLLRALQMSVTPKAHACETHACAQMELERGMGDYDEEFVERWHQEGKRNDVRTRMMRERATAFVYISKWEQMNRNPKVIGVQQDIKKEFALSEETKKKRKASRDINTRRRKQNLTNIQRERVRQQVLQNFVAPVELLPTAEQENNAEHNPSSN